MQDRVHSARQARALWIAQLDARDTLLQAELHPDWVEHASHIEAAWTNRLDPTGIQLFHWMSARLFVVETRHPATSAPLQVGVGKG